MTDGRAADGAGSEWTWHGVREAQLRATAAVSPAERLRVVEDMIVLAFRTGALPVYRVTFSPAVKVRVDASHVEKLTTDPREVEALTTFRVVSAFLHGPARPVTKDDPGPGEASPDDCAAPPGNLPAGEVLIVDSRGEERSLTLDRYLDLVGAGGQFADRQPLDWQAFAQQLAAARF